MLKKVNNYLKRGKGNSLSLLLFKNIVFIILLSILIFLCFEQTVHAKSHDLIITEILPNPIGNDSEGEFIEIFNASQNTYEITNIKIDDKPVRLSDENSDNFLNSNEFLIVHDDNFDITQYIGSQFKYGVVTSTSFSNTNDLVEIKYEDNIIDFVQYSNPKEGISIVKPFIQENYLSNHHEVIDNTDTVDFKGNKTSLLLFDNWRNYLEFQPYLEFQNQEGIWTQEVPENNPVIVRIKFPLELTNKENLFWNIDDGIVYNIDEHAEFSIPAIVKVFDYITNQKIEFSPERPVEITISEIFLNIQKTKPSDFDELSSFEKLRYESQWIEIISSKLINIDGWEIIDDNEQTIALNNSNLISNNNYHIITCTGFDNDSSSITILDDKKIVLDTIKIEKTDYPISLSRENNYLRIGYEYSPSKENEKISTKLRINEVFPNPSEDNEWIEIFNSGDKNIDLRGWHISDLTSIQDLPYEEIKEKEYFVIEEDNLKISLNNSGDKLSLISPDGEIVDILDYKSTEKDSSWIYWEGEYKNSTIITKGKENILGEEVTNLESETIDEIDQEENEAVIEKDTRVLGQTSTQPYPAQYLGNNITKKKFEYKKPENFVLAENSDGNLDEKPKTDKSLDLKIKIAHSLLLSTGIFTLFETERGKILLKFLKEKLVAIFKLN